ncbi:MAG: VWA domain-containing protein [Moorea sp. SIO3I7]|nr:VWA domain-containing protein [Moorena sp. SIO3I7]
MSEQELQVGLPEPQFVDNPENRCPVVLLLDTSGSMSGQPIQELNKGIQRFQASVVEDELATLRVEVAVVKFGGTVSLLQEFVTVDNFNPPELTATGNTPMGAAIQKGLDLLEDRKAVYKSNGILYYRPWLFLITDGAPTDPWKQAAQRVHTEEDQKKLLFFAVGVQGANMKVLKQIAPAERPPLLLNELNFEELFLWLSASLQRVSSGQVGEMRQLPAVGWGEVAT